ncbi:MAG: substrate-binding domain-containing protein [Acidobacteriota bacterium]
MKRLKILVSSLLFCVLVLPLLDCGKPQHGPEEKYWLVVTNVKIPYWQAAGSGLVRAATQLGVQAEMVGPDSFDPKAQQAEFRRVLGKKPSGILISVSDPILLATDINAAIAQGVPVITIDSDAPASKRLLFIGTHNYDAGMMGAKVVVDHLKEKGSVVIYTMPQQLNLNERLQGYKAVLATHAQIKLAEVIDIKGDPRIAFDKTMEMAEKGPLPDAFVCLEAIACAEVAEVLDRKRITGKLVVAMDTHERTLEWIQKGLIAATIAQKPFTMAFYGLKMLDDLHHHKPPSLDVKFEQDTFSPIPTGVDTGATLIDKANVNTFIEAQRSAGGHIGG